MKIIASDFDGTLCHPTDGVRASDISAIRTWRAQGYQFGIATGRGLNLIANVAADYDITCDFFVCANGAVIADQKGHLLATHALADDLLQDLFRYPMVKLSHYLICTTPQQAFIAYPYGPYQLDLVGFDITECSVAEIQQLTGVVQMSLHYDSHEEAERAGQIIARHYAEQLTAKANGPYLDLTPYGIDKATGLTEMLQLREAEATLYTIGDDDNDLPMLERFHGYTVPNGSPAAKQVADDVCPSVGALINKILAV